MSSTNSCAPVDGASSEDELLQRLNKLFADQSIERSNENKIGFYTNYNDEREKLEDLPLSLHLYSDELRIVMNDLETLCSEYRVPGGVELVNKVRIMVHNEIRQSLSHIDNSYQSAFHSMMNETSRPIGVAVHDASASLQQAESEESHHCAETGTPALSALSWTHVADGVAVAAASASASASFSGAAAAVDERRDRLRGACAEHTQPNVENTSASACGPASTTYETDMAVAAEMRRRQALTRTKWAHPRVSLHEGLSMTTALFAESLATLLMCEVVRIYLFDEHHNLHCSACYPFHARQGDPMRATYTEIMLAKELHSTVCDRCIAVNGSAPDYKYLTERDLQLVAEEQSARGWASMQSCLIFPILSSAGANRSYGMIHAVNKACTPAAEPNTFTAHDETIMSISARVLGCILTRYPAPYFTLRVGEALRRAIFPCDDTASLDDHLPQRLIDDDIAAAAAVANRAVASHGSMVIYRAPISSIYETRVHHTRKKKFAHLLEKDTTLSLMEFNMLLTNQSWQEGMQKNVQMHQTCRAFHDELQSCRLLLRNLLDGLAVTRVMESMSEVAEYLRKLELFGRSEGNDMIVEHTNRALMECSLRQRRQDQGGYHGEHVCPAAELNAHSSVPSDTARCRRGGAAREQPSLPSSAHRPHAPHRDTGKEGVTRVKLPVVARGGAASRSPPPESQVLSETPFASTTTLASEAGVCEEKGDTANGGEGRRRAPAALSRAAPSVISTSSTLTPAALASPTRRSASDATSPSDSLDESVRRRRHTAAGLSHATRENGPAPTDGGVDAALAEDLDTMIFRQSQKAQVNIGQMHYDGPEGIGMYSSNPAQKRDQMRMCSVLTARPVDDASYATHGGPIGSRASPPHEVCRAQHTHSTDHSVDTPSFRHSTVGPTIAEARVNKVPREAKVVTSSNDTRHTPRSAPLCKHSGAKAVYPTVSEMAQSRPFLLK